MPNAPQWLLTNVMPFDILTCDHQLAIELKDSAPSGVAATMGLYMTRAEEPSWIVVSLEFVRTFALDLNLFAVWLCTKCQNHDCRIEHQGETIPAEEIVIRRIASEDLEIGKKD